MKKFEHRYRAYIQQSHRRFAKLQTPTWTARVPPDSMFEDSVTYEDGVQIDMSKDDFDRLQADLLAYQELENKPYGGGYTGRHLSHNYEQEIREERIRKENPSVKLAYEKYLNLLRLVDSYYD